MTAASFPFCVFKRGFGGGSPRGDAGGNTRGTCRFADGNTMFKRKTVFFLPFEHKAG
jgi:hypothetical protein